METKTFLGQKPSKIERDENGKIKTNITPQLELSVPIMFSAMSYGSISYNAHESLARAAEALGIYYNTGEGGLHQDFYKYGANTIVQVASGRFACIMITSAPAPPSRSKWGRAQSRASAAICRVQKLSATFPARV